MKIGRHTFDVKTMQPMTLGDMVDLQGYGIDVKKLEEMTPGNLVQFIHHFVKKTAPEIGEEDVRAMPTGAVRHIMERLNAEADKDFLSN